MNRRSSACLCVILLSLLPNVSLNAVEFKTAGSGIELAAGSLGSFTLTYPEFVPPHKIIEVKAAGATATVRYEGGSECAVSAGKGEIALVFKNVPGDVKSWKMTTLIDIGFAEGGVWKIAEKEGFFPAEKAMPPQIVSLNGTSFTLKNAQGQSLSLTTPDYAFQQLTDNREWNWAVYHWQFIVPYGEDKKTAIGAAYDYESHSARMIERVRKWGFNSIGAFSPIPTAAHEEASFPYVAHLPINEWEGVPRIPGAHEVWDPFDPVTEAKMAENIARELPKRANDPLLIGWFIVNEPRYEELPRVIPSLNGEHACKRRFVAALKTKHTTVDAFNAAWQAKAASFDELMDAGLAVTTDAAKADVKAFVGTFLETYFTQIEKLFRQHDANHLLIGSRLQPITIEDEQLCRIMGRHLDVVSYNYYTFGVDTAALKRYHEWTGGKPMMLSEFFWASPKDSGLIGGREFSSQQERGLAYRNYVEQSAALGFVVGIEWFTLVDQATTGRWFSKYNGESYNTGLISVADRPWKDMLAGMMKTNHTIYELLLGKRAPFAWDDPRVKVPAASQ